MSNPFQNWTPLMIQEYNERVAARGRARELSDTGAPPERVQEGKTQPAATVEARKGTGESEEQLAQAVLEEIARRGWLCFRSAPCYRTGRKPGEPDLECWADGGRTFHVELKRPGGKLSTEQLGVIAWARKLGHEVFVVDNLQTFLAIVDGKP